MDLKEVDNDGTEGSSNRYYSLATNRHE